MKTSLAKLLAPYVLALLSLGVSGWVAYNKADKQTAVDFATLKTQRDADKDQLNHIQNQVDKLVEWAMGEKPNGRD